MALTEGKHPLEFLVSEEDDNYSRENVTVAAAAGAMVAGTVLGVITASGKYTAYSNSASDGTEVAAGVLCYPVDDLAADQKAVAIVRHAIVRGTDLTGADTAGKADLLAKGVLVR